MPRFNSSINVIGSVPDYGVMIDYIIGKYRGDENYGSGFKFRTEKSFKRFDVAIEDSILKFSDLEHKQMFYDALMSDSLSLKDKLLVLFWQLIYANDLFREITSNVLMKAIYVGRSTLLADEILSYLRFVKESNPGELAWSEATLKIVPSKYLTILKKLCLADGTLRKTISYPSISSSIFIYFVRWVSKAEPHRNITLENRFFDFGFYDRATLLNRLKKIEFTPLWDITQIGSDITLELKPTQNANI